MGTEPIDETSLHASRRYVYDAILSAIMECLPGHTADQCHDEIAKAWNHLYGLIKLGRQMEDLNQATRPNDSPPIPDRDFQDMLIGHVEAILFD